MIKMNCDNLSLKKGFDKFIVNCEVNNLAEMTIKYYKDAFNYFYKYVKSIDEESEDIRAIDINKTMMENYILDMKKKRLKDSTINTRLRGIRAILYYLMQEGEIDYFKIRLITETKENKKLYTDEEIKILLKRPNKKTCSFAEYRTWALENFFVATGVRSRSARNVKIRDLDFENDLIYIEVVKNRKGLVIPMSIALKKVLYEYLVIRKGEKEDYLFCNLEGEQLTKDALNNIIAKYNRRRGINKTGVHLFRHYYARKYIQNGGDCFRLQKLLGHSNLEMTRKYVELYLEDLQANYNNLNPLDTIVGNKEKIRMKAG